MLPLLALLGCTADPSRGATKDAASPDDVIPLADASADALLAPDGPSPERPMVEVTPLGAAPTAWRVGGVWIFSSPLGLIRDDFPSFPLVLNRLLAPQHLYSAREDVIGHARAHDGPYADEVERALRAMNLPASGRFQARDFVAPQALYLLFLIEATPAAPRALSQDGEGRPAVPLSLFPFSVRGSTLREGTVFDPDPVSISLDPPPSGAAASTAAPTHFFNVVAVSHEFGPAGASLPGVYTFPYRVFDADGAGYRIDARFSIACDAADRMMTPQECGLAVDGGVAPDAAADTTP